MWAGNDRCDLHSCYLKSYICMWQCACSKGCMEGAVSYPRVEFLKAISMMVACKGLPRASSSPACAKFFRGIIVEATDVSAHKGNSCHARLQHILHMPLHVSIRVTSIEMPCQGGSWLHAAPWSQ